MIAHDQSGFIDAARLEQDLTLEADVVIVGSGAAGGIAAETLAQAGLSVVVLESGGYYTASEFSQNEFFAMPMLYQDGGQQRSKDGQIRILQGRAVGGSTVVNWTTCFRTPDQTLQHWREAHNVQGASSAELTPWFEQIEKRLNIGEWRNFPANENNAILARGCDALGLSWQRMRRNVNGCANTGLCGLGCPVNAKQSMSITCLPSAVEAGASVYYHAKALRLEIVDDRVQGVEAVALNPAGTGLSSRKLSIKAPRVIAAAGAIRSPALLMRSGVPDVSGLLGKRTFLQPVANTLAVMPEPVRGYHGAPQSVYSDAFLWPDSGMGFKLEAVPTLPLTALVLSDNSIGEAHAALSGEFENLHSQMALLRDGFEPYERGGDVVLKGDERELLDYPVTRGIQQGAITALRHIAELQFAAGAKAVLPAQPGAGRYQNMAEFEADIDKIIDAGITLVSAHVMGGCQMGRSAKRSVVDSYGRHHLVEGLSVFDASIFPSSLGANPQQSIYAFALRNSRQLLADMGKSDA